MREFMTANYWTRAMLTASLGMLAVFLFVLSVSTLKSYHYIGSGVAATNTITVDGTGDAYQTPDIAVFSVTEIGRAHV